MYFSRNFDLKNRNISRFKLKHDLYFNEISESAQKTGRGFDTAP